MDVLQAISNRRSHRVYRKEQLPEETLSAILRAGLEAPSATNRQPWHFSVVLLTQNSTVQIADHTGLIPRNSCRKECWPRFYRQGLNHPAPGIISHGIFPLFRTPP